MTRRRRWWRRVCRVGVVGGVLSVCPLLISEQAHAVEMSAQFAPPPAIPVAGSVLGGTGVATGGTLSAAGAATVAGEVVLAAGVFFGSAYVTYTALDWAFGSPEQAGAQPPTTGTIQWKEIGRCMIGGAYSLPTLSGFTQASACAHTNSTSPANGVSWVVNFPAWRCRNGATSCSGAVRASPIRSNGVEDVNTVGISVINGGWDSAASGAAGQLQALFAGTQPNGTTPPTNEGVILRVDPDAIEWLPAPQHKWKTILSCKNKTSGATTTVTNTSAIWIESAPLKISVPQCSIGWIPTAVEIWETDINGTNQIKRYGWTAPADVTATTSTSPYKSCYPGGSDAPCVLVLYKVGPDGSLLVCGQTVDCSTFTATTSTQTQYRCLWGPHSMPLTDCQPLENWAQTQTVTQPTATASPTTGSTAAPLPTTGVQPPIPTTQPAESEQSCMQDAWSWNPVSWVYIPIKCGLKWAFVPSSAGMSGYSTRLKTAYDGTAPGKWVGAIDGLKNGLAVGDDPGCMGPRIDWDKLPDGHMYPFAACTGIMATVAGVTKLLATIAITFFGGLACLRALGSGLGWHPGSG